MGGHMIVEYTCKVCGKVFTDAWRERGRKYCSQKCTRVARQKRISLICVICGKEFWRHPSKIKSYDNNCCSRKCKYIALRKQRQDEISQNFNEPIEDLLYRLYHQEGMGIKKTAKTIGVSDRVLWDWFVDLKIERRSRTDAVKLQWVDNPERRELSANIIRKIDNTGDKSPAKRPEVREKIRQSKLGPRNPMYGAFGDKNPNWRGGKITYRGPGWNGIREQVKRRDKYTCQKCGSKENLQVHHIIPYRETKDNSFVNLITLCATCHIAIEYDRAALP